MDEQLRLGRRPTQAVAVALTFERGAWRLVVSSSDGERGWDRLTLDRLSTVDALEAIRVELERRLL